MGADHHHGARRLDHHAPPDNTGTRASATEAEEVLRVRRIGDEIHEVRRSRFRRRRRAGSAARRSLRWRSRRESKNGDLVWGTCGQPASSMKTFHSSVIGKSAGHLLDLAFRSTSARGTRRRRRPSSGFQHRVRSCRGSRHAMALMCIPRLDHVGREDGGAGLVGGARGDDVRRRALRRGRSLRRTRRNRAARVLLDKLLHRCGVGVPDPQGVDAERCTHAQAPWNSDCVCRCRSGRASSCRAGQGVFATMADVAAVRRAVSTVISDQKVGVASGDISEYAKRCDGLMTAGGVLMGGR